MNLIEAKTKLKQKGYSIRTTYTPKQSEIILEILDKTRIVAEFHDIESEYIFGCFIRNAIILPNMFLK